MKFGKEQWAEAFLESTIMAKHVLQLNRTKKGFIKVDLDSVPTSRELPLAAGVMIYEDYRMANEARTAARKLFWDKAELYLEAQCRGADPMETRRLLKAVRKFKNNEAESQFLAIWIFLQNFIASASQEKFWDSEATKEPWKIIDQFARNLELMAIGEPNGKEESSEGEGGGSTEGASDPERDQGEAHQGSVPSESEQSQPAEQGADREGGGVQGSGSGLEAGEGAVQKPGEEPSGSGAEASGGGGEPGDGVH